MIPGCAGFGNHVVYVDFNLFVHHIVEQGYHGSLISSTGILYAKWHDIVCISYPMSGECCLGFILLDLFDLVIA